MARRDQPGIGEIGKPRRALGAVDYGHLVTVLQQLPGCRDADDPGTKHDDFHHWSLGKGRLGRLG